MKLVFLLIPAFFLASGTGFSQQTDSAQLLALNQRIDDLVIQKQMGSLDSLYANDFVMLHGDGRTDGKKSWLANVAKSAYALRQHDSVIVQLHRDVAILRGNMLVQKTGQNLSAASARKIIRVFARRENRWQLLSHYTLYAK